MQSKQQKSEGCNHWVCNGCDNCGGWRNNSDAEKSCVNDSCQCHSKCNCTTQCDGECHFQRPYGFVPHAGCQLHNSMSEEELKTLNY